METITEWIAVEHYCRQARTELSFIEALEQSGLIHIAERADGRWINADELEDLECFTRWHYELEINLEGIEVIQQLLFKVKDQQRRLFRLESQLRQYESSAGLVSGEG